MSTPEGNQVLVEALGSSLRRGGMALGSVPGLLKRTLVEDAWREFRTPRGEVVTHSRFAEFVTTPPTKGLGADLDLIHRIVADDPEAADLLDRTLQGSRGGDRRSEVAQTNVDIVNVGRPTGNSRDAALRRLRADAPELHAEVVAGNLTAHAAMVSAGFRPKSATVPIGRGPEAVAATLRRHMSANDLAALIACLVAGAQADA